MNKLKTQPWDYEKYGNPEDKICIFCMNDASDDQLVCCGEYKGIITRSEYAEYYDIEDLEQL